jgi:hypothetical protein
MMKQLRQRFALELDRDFAIREGVDERISGHVEKIYAISDPEGLPWR